MATYNGERYIHDQLLSILKQISDNDEIIISDDLSTDNTINIIKDFNDERIKIVKNNSTRIGPQSIKNNKTKKELAWNKAKNNFENALINSSGDYIFLADQDDVWCENKISIMLKYLKQYDCVVSDAIIIDENSNYLHESYYEINSSKPGIIANILHGSYHGCCMAFNKNILELSLPFPKYITLHDIWIGLVSEIFGETIFIEDKLIMYRRHSSNVSSGFKSNNSLYEKIIIRAKLIIAIIIRLVRK